MNLIVRQANISGFETLVDIGIEAGYIVDIAPRITTRAASEIDAAACWSVSLSPILISIYASYYSH